MDWRTGQICRVNNGDDINKISSVVISHSLVWTSRSPSWLSPSYYWCILWKCAEIGSFSEIKLLRTANRWTLWWDCFISTTESVFLVFMVSDEKLTVCSAGTWQRRWPSQCCLPVRCGPWSLCLRGTARRERSLSTVELWPLYSEMKDKQRQRRPLLSNLLLCLLHYVKSGNMSKTIITPEVGRLTNLLKKDGERI